MITLIHGNDILTSRNYFLSQKDKDSLTFDAEIISPIELAQSMQGSGLFETKATNKIFIENLFTRKGTKSMESIAWVLNQNSSANVYIWADKEIGVKQLASFPKFENKNFKIPQKIWSFLDGIKPNSEVNVKAFHHAITGSEPEIIFAMLIRQFRLLLGISSESKNNIDEVKKLAPWQKTKLVRQASLFDSKSLKEIYRKIYKIEKSQKTGNSNLNLTQNIDILLLEI